MPSSRKRRRARKHRGEIRARFRVRCNGKLHWILLTDQGRLVLTGHDNLGAEHVVTAMTGEACRCVQVHKQWHTFVKHGTTTMRLAELPRELQPWAEEAHTRHNMRTLTRKSIQNASRVHFLTVTEKKRLAATGDGNLSHHERLKALKGRIERELVDKADDYAQTIMQGCHYHRPQHVHPQYENPGIAVVGVRNTYTRLERTFASYDEGFRTHDPEFEEYGVRRRYSLYSNDPIGLHWSVIKTRGVAHDPTNDTRVAVIQIHRPKPKELRDDQEIALAGRQNDATSVVRTHKCLLHRGEAGWEVAEWLPNKED